MNYRLAGCVVTVAVLTSVSLAARQHSDTNGGRSQHQGAHMKSRLMGGGHWKRHHKHAGQGVTLEFPSSGMKLASLRSTLAWWRVSLPLRVKRVELAALETIFSRPAWGVGGLSPQGNWQAQIQHYDDNSISGDLTIIGEPLVPQAHMEGQVSGSDVFGVLLDSDGNQVGTFEGSVSQGSANGTYLGGDGSDGEWAVDGSLPSDS